MENGERFALESIEQMRLHVVNVGTMRVKGALKHLRIFSVSLLILLLCNQVRSQDPAEVIRIESDLVDLKVSVLGRTTSVATPMLEQKDFTILEDGKPQEISFFQAADTPFDLVLLLDLSGSNSKKLKMIRNSAKRFVDAARDVYRIALVTFTDRPALYSSFSLDRKKLKNTIDEMDDAIGGTNFWDSMDWVLHDLVTQGAGLRRSAIVVMTDGVDSAIPGVAGPGSKLPFEGLLEKIRTSESIVFPIYLDTEAENVKKFHTPREAYAQAREQLAQIANICGPPMYKAARLSDLD